MKYTTLLTLASAAAAMPSDGESRFAKRQGVTANIAPPSGPPPNCMPNYSGKFGLDVQPIGGSTIQLNGPPLSSATATTNDAAKATQISDGQVQAGANTNPFPSATGSVTYNSSMIHPVGTVCNSQFTMTLSGGVLTDEKGRKGYIASNQQFQFDNPPQSGALLTAGWSMCPDGALALGGNTTFYECSSGSFYNLYDEDIAAQCQAIKFYALPDVCQQ